jgi:hypothetical protein
VNEALSWEELGKVLEDRPIDTPDTQPERVGVSDGPGCTYDLRDAQNTEVKK